MMKRKHKKLIKIILPKIWIAIFLFILIILAQGTWNAYKKSQYATLNKEETVKKLKVLKERAEKISSDVERSKTKRGLESEIREVFDVGLSGEKMIILVDAPKPKTIRKRKKETLLDKIKNFFK